MDYFLRGKTDRRKIDRRKKNVSPPFPMKIKSNTKNITVKPIPYNANKIKREAESHLHTLYTAQTHSKSKIIETLSSHDSRERKNNFLKHLINNRYQPLLKILQPLRPP